MKKIIILGAGMVGKAMAIDLSTEYKVKSVDIDQESLNYLSKNYPIETELMDVTDENILSNAKISLEDSSSKQDVKYSVILPINQLISKIKKSIAH